MANEIKRDVRLSWSKRGAQIISATSETIDQAGNNAIENVQIVGSTSEALTFGDVTGSAHVMFKNLNKPWSELTTAEKEAVSGETTAAKKTAYELAHTVYLGTTTPMTANDAEFKLVPGAGVSFLTANLSWYGIRQTNDVDLLVVAIEV